MMDLRGSSTAHAWHSSTIGRWARPAARIPCSSMDLMLRGLSDAPDFAFFRGSDHVDGTAMGVGPVSGRHLPAGRTETLYQTRRSGDRPDSRRPFPDLAIDRRHHPLARR